MPDRYGRLFNDLGLSPPEFAIGPSTVTLEAFLSLYKQVQAMASMMQMLAPLLPHIVQLATPSTDSTR